MVEHLFYIQRAMGSIPIIPTLTHLVLFVNEAYLYEKDVSVELDVLVRLINAQYSQRQIADVLGTSQGNVKYWLKKYGLRTDVGKSSTANTKRCPLCNTEKELTQFYKRVNRSDFSGYCKTCSNQYHTDRVKNVKIRMIEYKGGECERCHIRLSDSHYSIFDFHHLDPETKDPNFDRIKYQKWERIQFEIDKCVVVCSNCHRLIHAGF